VRQAGVEHRRLPPDQALNSAGLTPSIQQDLGPDVLHPTKSGFRSWAGSDSFIDGVDAIALPRYSKLTKKPSMPKPPIRPRKNRIVRGEICKSRLGPVMLVMFEATDPDKIAP
jgi:hypothetical protein